MSQFVEMNASELEETQGGVWVAIAFGLGLAAGYVIGHQHGRADCD